jgi:hypothetical protein
MKEEEKQLLGLFVMGILIVLYLQGGELTEGYSTRQQAINASRRSSRLRGRNARYWRRIYAHQDRMRVEANRKRAASEAEVAAAIAAVAEANAARSSAAADELEMERKAAADRQRLADHAASAAVPTCLMREKGECPAVCQEAERLHYVVEDRRTLEEQIGWRVDEAAAAAEIAALPWRQPGAPAGPGAHLAAEEPVSTVSSFAASTGPPGTAWTSSGARR